MISSILTFLREEEEKEEEKILPQTICNNIESPVRKSRRFLNVEVNCHACFISFSLGAIL